MKRNGRFGVLKSRQGNIQAPSGPKTLANKAYGRFGPMVANARTILISKIRQASGQGRAEIT